MGAAPALVAAIAFCALSLVLLYERMAGLRLQSAGHGDAEATRSAAAPRLIAPNCSGEVFAIRDAQAQEVAWVGDNVAGNAMLAMKAVDGHCNGLLFFDVGANEGREYMLGGMISAACREDQWEAHFFEPTHWYRNLVNNTSNNRRNHPHNYAVSDEPGEVSLYRPAGFENVTRYESTIIEWRPGHVKVGSIQRITIDGFLAATKSLAGRHVNFMKIDVEGWEMHVLRGAMQTLRSKRVDVLQYECHGDENQWPFPCKGSLRERGRHSMRLESVCPDFSLARALAHAAVPLYLSSLGYHNYYVAPKCTLLRIDAPWTTVPVYDSFKGGNCLSVRADWARYEQYVDRFVLNCGKTDVDTSPPTFNATIHRERLRRINAIERASGHLTLACTQQVKIRVPPA